jgi:hypothetical protein
MRMFGTFLPQKSFNIDEEANIQPYHYDHGHSSVVYTMKCFEHFPRIPENVRLNIWKHAASVPRVVGIYEEHHMVHLLDDNSIDTSLVSTTRPPAILGVCRESRVLGLEIYKTDR